jgi:quercetin dioxygenase-like cupin family protein
MKNLTHLIIAALFTTVISIFTAQTTMAQDPVKVDAKHYKVEVENARVRVLRVNYGPKEKSVMHRHPASVVLSLTDLHGKFTLSGGKMDERQFKAGDVRWAPAERHLPENISDQPFEVILIELKGGKAAAKSASAAAEDPVKVAPQVYKVEFENAQVRVLRVKVGPHEKTPMHAHPANVVIFLTDGQLKFTLPDGKTEEAQAKAGQIMLNEQQKHAGENLGDQPFEAVVVELKAK